MRELGDWTFSRRDGVGQVTSPSGIVLSASASAAGSGIAGVDALGLPEGVPPENARTHTLRMRFRSRGFFSAEPGAHFAIGLTGLWRKGDPNVTPWNGALMGRGVIVGNVSGAPDGCPRWPVVQLESFRDNGNALIAESGSGTLLDDTWYALDLRADLDGRVAYALRDAQDRQLSAHSVEDRSERVPPNLGGWWITHVFSDGNAASAWAFDVAGLTLGWV